MHRLLLPAPGGRRRERQLPGSVRPAARAGERQEAPGALPDRPAVDDGSVALRRRSVPHDPHSDRSDEVRRATVRRCSLGSVASEPRSRAGGRYTNGRVGPVVAKLRDFHRLLKMNNRLN